MEGATGGVEVKPGPARGIALPREDGYCDVIRPGIERETRSATEYLGPFFGSIEQPASANALAVSALV